MTNWLRNVLGLTVDEAALIVAVLALLVAIPAAVPAVRSVVVAAFHRILLLCGIARRKYQRWFLKQHGKLQNIYLNRIEELDLAQTYVSLSFVAPQLKHEGRVKATQVLAQHTSSRIVIVGDPGSGKSTLLNAYGTGILRKHSRVDSSDLKAVSRTREVPFLVKLRHFAKYADGSASLANYLVKQSLQAQARIPGGHDFLLRLLKHNQCLVLLDGLDEVPDNRYELVRDAILEFASGSATPLPTDRARIVLSCRRQNFLRIQTDWVPVFSDQPYILAPLRDSEIFFFLLKRKQEFAPPRTPETFFASIKNSNTIEMHRTPLILTISLGLYLHLTAYEIPGSIGKFYDAMINELLTRHDFRGDHSGSTNQFNAEDKYRFLREFALTLALREGNFEDFSFQEADTFAEMMIPKMSHVRIADAHDFIGEIIDRSGLLTRTSDEDEYIFAHRSIQEFLIAVQLKRDPSQGARFLLERALDSEWRQPILFFVAMDHQYVETFIGELSGLNLELSGYCLAAAGPLADTLSSSILSRLSEAALENVRVTANLAAIVSITGAQKEIVREQALATLSKILTSFLGRKDLISVLGTDSEALLRLLQALAETDSAEIAATVPALLSAISVQDERVVGVLWRCLAAAGMESEEASIPIVELLLVMTMQETGFEELQRQPSYVPTFITDNLRKAVYPFEQGLNPKSNLVTLLCWAQKRGVALTEPNRYLEAKDADPQAFANVERDYRRRTLALRPFKFVRIGTIGALSVALFSAIAIGILDRRRIDPLGNWFVSVPLYFAPGILAAVLAGIIANASTKLESRRETLYLRPTGMSEGDEPVATEITRYSGTYRSNKSLLKLGFAPYEPNANLIFRFLNAEYIGVSDEKHRYYWDSDTLIICAWCVAITSVFTIGLATLGNVVSIAGWLAIATVTIWLAFWFPATDVCARGSVIYVRKPNRFVDMYEDSRTRHWVVAQVERQ
jgi:energy-coupling factor transporter ATP-binding protein EcfA2